MKEKLKFTELVAVASMLFGMFFGSGNVIFPVHLGQLAGSNVIPATIGFIITGVGIPLLGVVALGRSHSSGLYDMASRVGKGYGVFFTCLLTLTIGPCFVVPRCATVSFTVGLEPLLGDNRLALLIFSVCFFAAVIFFSLRPGNIMTWIGKILNPAFLVFFCGLIIVALINPPAAISEITPDAAYQSGALFNGILEGYNTMDAIASLVFGVVVVDVIRGLGIKEEKAIAANTAKAGILTCIAMALIYLGACIMGTQSMGVFELSETGGTALAQICGYYFGGVGQIFLAVMVTLACLKTAIGLVTSIAKVFDDMFTKGKCYEKWTWGFTVFACLVSNVGLSLLIKLSVPVLMFIYPLAVVLILLAIFGDYFEHDRRVYVSVTALTLVAAIFDFCKAAGIMVFDSLAGAILPFYSMGFGWIVPSLIGLVIGLVWRKLSAVK